MRNRLCSILYIGITLICIFVFMFYVDSVYVRKSDMVHTNIVYGRLIETIKRVVDVTVDITDVMVKEKRKEDERNVVK